VATSIADLANATPTTRVTSKTVAAVHDRRRSWLWGFLAVVALSQLYFVREVLAAFALFAIAFLAVAAVVVALYMLHNIAQLAAARLAALRAPALQVSPVPHEHKPA
jgi:hypothetical protein